MSAVLSGTVTLLSQAQIAAKQGEHCKETIRINAAQAIGILSDIVQWGHLDESPTLVDLNQVREYLDSIEAAYKIAGGKL
jgi:hypothetical protein